ncbi:MAG TPA: hypothetical protein DCX54_09445 [Flavobacteriales bacterium]|nr:hypothetical protein [Flavobacteriales bacterium]
MKRFLLNALVFALPLIIISYIKPLHDLYTESYKRGNVGDEIYHSIKKSKRKTKSKKVFIGDSTGQQFFPNKEENESLYSLACNQAIGVTGHFLLLNNYFLAGNNADTVFVFFTPYCFKNNLDQIYTYHYFLKPFYTDEYKPYLSERVMDQVKKIPFYFLCQEPHILTSEWAPNFSSKDKISASFLSDLSVEYVQKIKTLCAEHNAELIFISPPMRDAQRSEIEAVNKEEFENLNLQDEFKSYFNSMIFLNDTNFRDDFHLKRPEEFKMHYANLMAVEQIVSF